MNLYWLPLARYCKKKKHLGKNWLFGSRKKKIQRVQIEGLESLTVSKLRTVRIKRAFSGKEPIKFFSRTLINSAYGKDQIKDMALPTAVSNELSVGTIKLEKEREEWS